MAIPSRISAVLFLTLALPLGAAFPAEEVTLTAPVTKPSQTLCKLDRITIDVTAKSIHIQVLGNNGEIGSKVYNATTTPTGAVLLNTLNTANLTANSLVRRALTRLITDGVCVGTVAGTPD